MTVTRDEFNAQIRRLRVLRNPPEGGPDVQETYWNVMKFCTLSDLIRGVDRTLLTSAFFPTPSELREMVELGRDRPSTVEPDRSRPTSPKDFTLPDGTVIHINAEWTYYCDHCSDLGWMTFWCDGGGGPRPDWLKLWLRIWPCGRYHRPESPGHEWSDPCGCSATNPALVRKRGGPVTQQAN